jgi:hypothetical protein
VSPLFEGTFIPGMHFDLDSSTASATSDPQVGFKLIINHVVVLI